ncbi:hypothetical protein Taro_019102 [Colocasia esculenta]|uniref:Uncharacterized protein n=1 Tax=Colocasia esculenta TaxID=4460 RepID=A0A843UVR9_COLES|nr:hypothetical protein [Colocasia esculenta]
MGPVGPDRANRAGPAHLVWRRLCVEKGIGLLQPPLNFVALQCSIPIIVAGTWLAFKQDNKCVHLVQWPIIILGSLILLVSLAIFVGAYGNHQCLLTTYLLAMAILIILLLALLMFAFTITRPDNSYTVPNWAYKECRLSSFSSWLRDQITSASSWARIQTCLNATNVCGKLGQCYLNPNQFI